MLFVGEHAAFVGAQADVLQTEALGVRATTDGHQHVIGFQQLGSAASGRLDAELHTVGGSGGAGDFRTQLERDALFAQRALQGFAGLAIDARADAVEVFDHGDLRAEPPPYRAQLQTDHTGTDHHQVFGHFTQGKRTGRIKDTFVVDLDTGQGSGLGTGGDDDVLGGQFDFAAMIVGHRDLAGAVDVAPALDPVDLVLAKQKFDAFGQASHAFVFLFHHLHKI
ncbi:hypothetical protein D3C72_558570 [compost metagenome]